MEVSPRQLPLPMSECRTCLVLSMRHMGDAVILSGLVNALGTCHPEMSVDVLGRPELAEVSRSFSVFRDYIGINLPFFRHHRRDGAALKSAVRTMQQVRRRKYDYCVNTIGDVRENLISRLTGAKISIAPVWEPGHLFKRKMTDKGAALLAGYGVRIPSSLTSYYDSLEYFSQQLGIPRLLWKRKRSTGWNPARLKVALHPGASHPSRYWPYGKWRELMRDLWKRGCDLTLLGSVAERERLLDAFGEEVSSGNLRLITDEIPQFMASLTSSDVLIGMDSFSVHAAYALGIPAIVLNGSADMRILTPPGDPAVSAGHLCPHYPCYYAYSCRGGTAEYVCVRGIEATTIMEALDEVIKRMNAPKKEAGPV